ncbi:MAG: hypothetical protein D6690_07080 [Nitrospirae bacterium]|nr:MAG: hypothetical protein D6690_07080 [Nitrospirota bacterium]
MNTISFGGLGNGIDFGPIIDFLVQTERIPIDRLTDQKLKTQEKLTDYGTLGTKLLSLQSAASSLRSRVNFDKTKVDVSTASTKTLLTATSSSTATAGTYTITVNRLAAAHQIASKSTTAVSSTDTDIVSGDSATFTFKVGSGSNQTVSLAADATLEDLKNAINDLGAGVSASLLNSGTEASPQYRLVLTSTNTGASNAITVVTDSTTLDMVTTGIDTFQAAQDSQIVLGAPGSDQVTLDRSTNTITDAVTGVTLNLQGVDASNPVTITVSQDLTAVKDGIKSLIEKYNEVVTFINERTVFDPETEERGIFVGETLPRTVLDKLRQALSNPVSGVTTLTGGGQIGFETQTTDGTIVLDETDLDKQLNENYSAVRDLFIENPTTGTVGIAERLFDAVDDLDDVESGLLTLRQNTLTDEVDDLGDQIAKMEADLVQFEEQQRIKFARLDGLLKQLDSQLNILNSRL